jgi:lipopolysaccharide transport system permease protein
MMRHLRELYRSRSLLMSLISRDLRVRYRGSVFGFLWTFLNPLLLMMVYSLVFSVYNRSPSPHYTYFLFVGLLPWGWFATSLLTGTQSISDRRDLVSKVKFPPQILPMTVIGSALVNYLLSLPLMFGLSLMHDIKFGWSLVCFPFILMVQMLLTTGIVYITSSINVVFRDLQHILSNLVTFLFFLTPVLYSTDQIPEKWRPYVTKLNPMAELMDFYRNIFFEGRWPSFERLGTLALISSAVFFVGCWFMNTRREGFAESV